MSALRHLRVGCVLPLGGVMLSLQFQKNASRSPLAMPPPSPEVVKSLCTFPANNPTEDRLIYHEEDNTRVFGVFDGHGGWNVSNYLQNNLTEALLRNLRESKLPGQLDGIYSADAIESSVLTTFTELEENYIKKIRAAYELGFGEVARVGSCALVAVVQENTLVVANAGDCLAVLGQVQSVCPSKKIEAADNDNYGMKKAYLAHQINREHNARNSLESLLFHDAHPNEPDIVKCKNSHACYVKGRLQLTRAFGDLYLKSHEFNAPAGEHRSRGRHIPPPYSPPYVNYTPDVYKLTIDKKKDKFVILATDGLWDFMEPQEAVDIVASESCPEKAAESLVEEALARAAEEANLSVSELKSLPPGRARRTKFDDTTVVVAYL